MLNLRKGFSVTFADKLIEGYKSDGKSITANVSAEKTLPLLEQFIKLHEDEKLFFVLELPTPETAEPKDENGLLYAGNDGTTDESYEINGDFEQEKLPVYTFKNTDPDIDWCYLRKYHPDNYELSSEKYVLKGTDITLDDVDSPTFIALRQRDFVMELSADVKVDRGEGGITMYMCENEHYDIALRKTDNGTEAVLKLNIGGIKHEQNKTVINGDTATLIVRADNYNYNFFVRCADREQYLGSGQTKYLTSEVSGGFTGTMTGFYAVGGTAEFSSFVCKYSDGE